MGRFGILLCPLHCSIHIWQIRSMYSTNASNKASHQMMHVIFRSIDQRLRSYKSFEFLGGTWHLPCQIYNLAWRRFPMYGRDVVCYCYLCPCNLCRSLWLTSSDVVWNICSVAYLVLSGHFKRSCAAISCYILPLRWEPWYIQIKKYFCNGYASLIVVILGKRFGDVTFQR